MSIMENEQEKQELTFQEKFEEWISVNWRALFILLVLFIIIGYVGYKPIAILPRLNSTTTVFIPNATVTIHQNPIGRPNLTNS